MKYLLAFNFLFLFLAFAALVFHNFNKTNDFKWNQKLEIIVSTSEGIYRGYSVQSLQWRKNNFYLKGLESDTWKLHIKGEAPFVELPDGRVVVAALDGDEYNGIGSFLIEKTNGITYNRHTNLETYLSNVVLSSPQTYTIHRDSYLDPKIIIFENNHDPNFFTLLPPKVVANSTHSDIQIIVQITRTDDALTALKLPTIFSWFAEFDAWDTLSVKAGSVTLSINYQDFVRN